MNRLKRMSSLCFCCCKAADDETDGTETESDGCSECSEILDAIQSWVVNMENDIKRADEDAKTLILYSASNELIPERESDNLQGFEGPVAGTSANSVFTDQINDYIKRALAISKKLNRNAEIVRLCLAYTLITCSFVFSKEENDKPIASPPVPKLSRCQCKCLSRINLLQDFILRLRLKMEYNDMDLLICLNHAKATYSPNYREQEEGLEEQAINSVVIGKASENKSQSEQKNPVLQSLSDNKKRNSECYPMDCQIRGRCLYFGHQFFDHNNLDERENIPKEKEMIKKTFKKLGFKTEFHIDLTYKKIIRILKELTKQNFENDDCICIVISTHGLSGGLLWAKDVCYPFEIFEDKLARIKSLINKPKIFFIQTCRGLQVDRGIHINGTSSSSSSSSSSSEDEIDGHKKSIKVPTKADFFKAYSSPPGYLSFREWFLKELCQNLDTYSETEDIETIVKITSKEIRKLESKTKAKQVIYVEHTLDKKVYFKKKV